MKPAKDRHLNAPGEANRDKHINFLTEENGDANSADEKFNDDNGNTPEVDNGFFTDDDNELQNKEENDRDKANHPAAKNKKVTPLIPDEKTTLGDRITVANKNEDILTPVKDDEKTAYTNNTHQAG